MTVRLYTIGFTKKLAEDFFGLIKQSSIKCLIDIRLNNSSQLAGFAKGSDLAFFLKEICNCAYRYEPSMAPTKELLDSYLKKQISWDEYVKVFTPLLQQRQIEKHLQQEDANMSCLLCSEPTANYCHRRLVAEYLRDKWENVEIDHL